MISSLFYFLKILTHQDLTMTLWIIFMSQLSFRNFCVHFCKNYIFFMFSISPVRFSLDTLLWFSPWEETSKLSEINSPKNTISNDSLSNHRFFKSFWVIVMIHYLFKCEKNFLIAKKFSGFFNKKFTATIFNSNFSLQNFVIFVDMNQVFENFWFEVTLENQRY